MPKKHVSGIPDCTLGTFLFLIVGSVLVNFGWWMGERFVMRFYPPIQHQTGSAADESGNDQ